MISLNNFDKLETQNDTRDSQEKEANTDEFFAFLAALSPVLDNQKPPEKVENFEGAQAFDFSFETANENGKNLTSGLWENQISGAKANEKDIFTDKEIVLPKTGKLPPENAFEQNNLPENFKYPAKFANENEISAQSDEKMLREKGFEIIADKTSPPLETMPVWLKQSIENTKVEEKSKDDFLPKIFKSITEKSDENKTAAVTDFAVNTNSAETVEIKPEKIEASDILTQDFHQSQTEAKKPKPGANSDIFGARDLNNLPASVTNVSRPTRLAPLNPPDGDKVFEQVRANLHEEIIIFAAKPEKTNILKLRLRPAELGAVEIKLEKTDSGKLNAFFQTENDTTREIFVERAEQLRDALQNSGWEIEKLDISCGSPFSAGSGSRENQSRQTENVGSNLSREKLTEDISENDSSADRLVSLRA